MSAGSRQQRAERQLQDEVAQRREGVKYAEAGSHCSQQKGSRRRARKPTVAEQEAELLQEIEQRKKNPLQWGQFQHCDAVGCSSAHAPAKRRQQLQQPFRPAAAEAAAAAEAQDEHQEAYQQQQEYEMDVDADDLLAEEGQAAAAAGDPGRALLEAALYAEAQQKAKGGRRKCLHQATIHSSCTGSMLHCSGCVG
jgi:hypothetical protein